MAYILLVILIHLNFSLQSFETGLYKKCKYIKHFCFLNKDKKQGPSKTVVYKSLKKWKVTNSNLVYFIVWSFLFSKSKIYLHMLTLNVYAGEFPHIFIIIKIPISPIQRDKYKHMILASMI